MCLISLQPSTEASIAQVLMRHLLLRTLEKACNSAMKIMSVSYARQMYLPRILALMLNFDKVFE